MYKSQQSFFIVFLVFTFSMAGFSQKWELKNPLPTYSNLKDVCLINHDTGFVCGTNQVILKTTDGGETWHPKGWKEDNQLNGIAFSCRDTGFAVGWGGILRTMDCGENWEQLPSPFVSDATDLVDVFFLDKQHGWICGNYYAVIRTQDGGITWDVLNHNVGGPFQSYDIVKFISPDIGFMAGSKNTMQNGVLQKTVNGGVTWIDINIPAEIEGVSGMEIISQNEIWIGARNQVSTPNGGEIRIYHTLDGGASWITTTLINYGTGVNSIKFIDALHGRVLCGFRMFITNNGGVAWQENILSYDMAPLDAMAWADTSKCISVGYYGYMFNSGNGGQSWNEVSQGTKANFSDICFTNPQTGFAVGNELTPAAIYKTQNGGNTWVNIPFDSITPGHLNAIHFSDESNGWTAGYWGLLLHTINGGQEWSVVNPGLQPTYYALDLYSSKYIWAGGYQGKLIRSGDYGSTWQDISLSYSNFDINRITFLDSLNGYVVFTKQYDNAHGLMFRTSDGGINWTAIDFINSQTKGILGMSFTDALTGYISIYNEGVAKTTDGGITWQSLGKIGDVVPAFLKFTNAQQGLAATRDNFVARTNNGGQTWEILINNLPPPTNQIKSFFFPDLDHGWLAGLHGLIEEYTSVGVGCDEQKISLNGAPVIFPNPVGDILTFSCQEEAEQAKIYNLNGQLLKSFQGTSLKMIVTQGLPPGGYVLGLSTHIREYFVRFIKQ